MKHIFKSKYTKYLSIGPLLEVKMSKKCTPLCHEAHFQVKMLNHISKIKMYKNHMFASLLDVQISFRVAGTRDSNISKNDGRHGIFEMDL